MEDTSLLRKEFMVFRKIGVTLPVLSTLKTEMAGEVVDKVKL